MLDVLPVDDASDYVHLPAVTALAWRPGNRAILATGGGILCALDPAGAVTPSAGNRGA